MSSVPQIPPRPSRSPANDPLENAPKIPPRPNRRAERSLSPSRAEYSRSPLNEPPAQSPNRNSYGQTLSGEDLPKRPSSAFIPANAGEEGLEYASYNDQAQDSDASGPKQRRTIAADLPMHAPKATVPQTTASSRIQTVTRTDSSQAAAAGIGSVDPDTHPLKARSSFSRSNLSLGRPGSAQGGDEEHGPPTTGLQVPMLKYAGDAQAPSPAPGSEDSHAPSTGHHHRKRSSRHEFGPPGSYGLHGHGLNSFHGISEPTDKFERDWYQKHPDEFKKEQGRIYDPGHPSHEWALSSDDLNRLVHQSSNNGLGMGTSPEAIGTPSEQIGYLASEEYTSRMNSPRPSSFHGKRLSSGNQPAIASPLRKASVPGQENYSLKQQFEDQALESDAEDVIHVDPPAHRTSKVGGGGYDPPTEDFGPEGGNTEQEGGWVVENGYGVPILASDEVARNPDPAAAYMQPAVSPEQEKRGSDYYAGWDSDAPPSYQTGRRSSKDKVGRSGSGQGEPMARIRTRDQVPGSGVGTPLEEIEEYEPLFPEDEKEPPKTKALDGLRRSDLARHHFPSQDVWEDTPESLQHQTTVDTPQEPEDLNASTTFEHPAKESARKDGNDPQDRADFLTDETQKMAKPHFKPGVMDELRPHHAQRFPSQDIWEDSPDSLHYQTTVSTPQMPEDLETSTGSLPPQVEDDQAKPKFKHDVAEEHRRQLHLGQRFPSPDIWEDTPDSLYLETTVSGPQTPEENILSPESAKSPPEATFAKPQIPARPGRPSKLGEESSPAQAQPNIPARPPQKLRQVPPADAEVPQIPARPGANKAAAPVLPDRPKPHVPARPARVPRSESQENTTLSKTVSNVGAESASSAKSPPEVKAKPAIPSRPVNANFANLKASFMENLNSRLKLGPQAPKKEEEPEETKPEQKAPLADARKGRTKGPARRKPAASAVAPIPAEQDEASKKSVSLAITTTFTVWQIGEAGDVSVPDVSDPLPFVSSAEQEVEKIAAINTESAAPTDSAVHEEFDKAGDNHDAANNTLSDPVGYEGDVADPSKLSSATIERQQAIQPGLEEALADSARHGETPTQGATDVAAAVPDFTSETAVEGGQAAKDAATEAERTAALNTEPAGGAESVEHTAAAVESTPAESKPEMIHHSAQTGEKEITVKSPTGEEEKISITLGGSAPDHGDVVKKAGGEEVLGAETAGHGM